MAPRKLAIITSHPIQYYAPVFRALALSGLLDLRVFYTWSQAGERGQFDAGFGAVVAWDVPLLAGYHSEFVPNVARRPGVEHFGGLNNPTLIREIERWGAEAVLVYGWNARSHLRALRHFAGRIPVLFRGDSTLLDRRPPWRSALRRVVLRWVYAHVDTAIAVGSNSRDYFAWCGIPENRIAVAPHSVDTAHFADATGAHEARAAAWRRELGIGPQTVAFLFAGKLQAKKDPGLLLDAFAELPGDAHLIFVGNGDLEQQLKARAGTVANVHFLAFQNQSVMPAAYRLGDLFVLPSRGPGETWGLALNEAMASGRAVVASSKVGGARDLVRSGETGWTFEAGDQAALSAILRAAVSHGRTALGALGARALEASAGWSTEESARRIAAAVIASRTR